MKILMVNNKYSDFGGAEVILKDNIKYYQHTDNKLYFYSCQSEQYFNNSYEYIKYFPKAVKGPKEYILHPVKYYYNKEAQKNLEKLIKVIHPDLIHLHTIGEFTYSILNSCKNIPTVMTVHSAYQVFCPSTTQLYQGRLCNQCNQGNYLPCIKNRCVRGSFEPSVRNALKATISYKNFKNIDYFITPSEILRKQIIKANVGVLANCVSTIPNFLSREKYNTIPRFENNGYFLYAGRLTSVKGIHYILQALNELPQIIPLHIAGTGDFEKALRKYVLENNLSNVTFLGHLTQEELNNEYQNCIAVIVPSNWFEIFGMINIEAFINGKPVIASNIGGIPEIVEHNKNGLLFEPGNVKQLKECILTYWNNPKLVIQHGKNGYKKAREKYGEEQYYEKVMQIYKKVIQEYKEKESL